MPYQADPHQFGTNGPAPAGQPNYAGTPQAGRAQDPGGLGAVGNWLGLSTPHYQATTATADYGGKAYGQGAGLAGSTGQAMGDVRNGNFSFAPGAYQSSGRVNNDYGLAAQQVGPIGGTYDSAYGLGSRLMQEGSDRAVAAQMAAARSGNPAMGGAAQYQAANLGAQMQAQGRNQAADMAAQYKQQYDMANLNAALQNRQQNLGLLGLSQNESQFGANYDMGRGQMNQDLYKYLAGLQQGYAQQDLEGQQGYAQLASNNFNHAQDINAGYNQGSGSQVASGMGGAVDAMAMMAML